MLVLSRKVGERVIVGGIVTVMVTRVTGDKVHLGFEAPEDVEIHREEIFDLIIADRAEDERNAVDHGAALLVVAGDRRSPVA